MSETQTERPSADWTYWKHHLIGCVDCTAGNVCAEGRRILVDASPDDAPWLRQRPSAERLQIMRDWSKSLPRDVSKNLLQEALTELDAVTRERDDYAKRWRDVTHVLNTLRSHK